MKTRKPGQSKRRAASAAGGGAKKPTATDEPKVTGLEHGGEIRLTQLLRALTGELPPGAKPVH